VFCYISTTVKVITLPNELLDSVSKSILVPSPDTKASSVLRLHVGYGCTYCYSAEEKEFSLGLLLSFFLLNITDDNKPHRPVRELY
jgi:hypothetical protein